MKKNYLYIIIVLLVILVFGTLLYWLNTTKSEINQEHVKLKFIIHNCSGLAKNEEILKKEVLQPLLKSHFVINKSSTEDLFITSIGNEKFSFCIPAMGINYFRYDRTAPLSQSSYTSTARENDESSFFENWKGGEQLDALVKTFLEGDRKLQQPDVSKLLSQNKSKYIDSLILCSDCSDSYIRSNEPFIFKNTSDLRKFVNQQIQKFPASSITTRVNNSIHIFTYCGNIENTLIGNSVDSDGDGIPDNFDGCPKEKGSKELKGCPDDDGDKVPNNVDQCPKKKGESKCSGCPCEIGRCPSGDKDLDGVCDDKDNCPNDFGQIQFGGCPPDSDGDGLWDKFDKCPFEKGLKKFQGCPDKDGDNVPDYQDKCPNVKGGVNCNGCICSEEEPTKPIITIGLSGSKFQINGVSIGGEYTATLTAKGKKSKEYTFTSNKCPSNSVESHSLANQIESDDLTVTIVVFKNGKEIKRDTFFNMSYVCFKGTDCGFKKL